jgi:uncharacterized protein YndB with AHSA1/START domain
MIKAENSAHVKTSVEKLFEFVTDPTNESKWHTDVVEVHPVTEGPTRVGTTTRWVFNFMGKRDGIMEVTELEPNRLERIVARKGPMGLTPTITYRFERDGDGSKFTRAVEMEPKGLSRLMTPMMRSMVPKQNAAFVANLAKLFES